MLGRNRNGKTLGNVDSAIWSDKWLPGVRNDHKAVINPIYYLEGAAGYVADNLRLYDTYSHIVNYNIKLLNKTKINRGNERFDIDVGSDPLEAVG